MRLFVLLHPEPAIIPHTAKSEFSHEIHAILLINKVDHPSPCASLGLQPYSIHLLTLLSVYQLVTGKLCFSSNLTIPQSFMQSPSSCVIPTIKMMI